MKGNTKIIEMLLDQGPTLLIKSVLNPSGPSDLSIGKFFTTVSISSVVKGSVKQSNSDESSRSSVRLKCMKGESEDPSLSLKASQI